MKNAIHIVVAILAVLLIAVSFIPLVETYWWIVRLADFPRLQFLVALLVIGAALLFFVKRAPLATGALFIGVLAAILANATTLWPFRPSGADFVSQCAEDRQLSVMVANVLLGNRNTAPLLEMVLREEPDLFLAMETDEWWDRALSPLAQTMPHRLQKITGSYYGIHLFSRRPLVAPEILNLASPETPAIYAGVTLKSGETIDFVGLHPRPPLPFQSTLGRDAQLYAAALIIRDGEKPAVVAGDLNATPWETAVERMQRIGSLNDPRRGYGYVPTYSATSWWQSWPLDHVLHEAGFATMSLRRLGYFGSDHYPYIVRLCRVAEAQDDTPPALHEGDLRQAEAAIEAAHRRSTAPRSKSGGG